MYVDGRTRTHGMLERIMTDRAPGYAYGMGRARSLREYLDWAGVNWSNRSSTSNDKFCKGQYLPGWNVTQIKRRYANRTMPVQYFKFSARPEGLWPSLRLHAPRRLQRQLMSAFGVDAGADVQHGGAHHRRLHAAGGEGRDAVVHVVDAAGEHGQGQGHVALHGQQLQHGSSGSSVLGHGDEGRVHHRRHRRRSAH